MTRLMALAPLILLGGCDFLNNTGDSLSGLVNPMVGVGLIIGAEAPDQVDLSSTGIDVGTAFTLFLADAASVTDLSQAPITGASVTLDAVPASEDVPGLYSILPTAGLTYAPDATWAANIALGDTAASLSVALPSAATVAVPVTHDANTPMTIDLTGQGFNAYLAVVIEVSSGDMTWSNQPETITDVYNISHGAGTVDGFDIPADAFPNEDAYVVGVAGLVHGDAAGITGMNTILSSVVAGTITWGGTSTLPPM